MQRKKKYSHNVSIDPSSLKNKSESDYIEQEEDLDEDEGIELKIISRDSIAEKNESNLTTSDSEEESENKHSHSGQEHSHSFSNCCRNFFCCCFKHHSRRNIRPRRRTREEQDQFERNCRREDGFNTWSASSNLPLNATSYLVDRTLLPNDSPAVPAYAFTSTLHSIISIGTNIYFLLSNGDHSTGSRWSIFMNTLSALMSIALLVISLVDIGIEQEHNDQDTVRLILEIFINCLIAGITFVQSTDLAYHGYNQINKNPITQLQRDEDIDVERED